MSSNTSPTGAQHQGEASPSKPPVLSTPYEESTGVRRQSVFQAAAKGTAPHTRSSSTTANDTSEGLGNTEELEAVAPAAAPGADHELHDQPSKGSVLSAAVADGAPSDTGSIPESSEPAEPERSEERR